VTLDVASTSRTFTFTGSGFAAGEMVSAVVHSDPVDLGVKAADANGVVVFTWTAPADFSGSHQVVMTGLSGQVSGWFDLPGGPTAGTTSAAPTTGTTSATAPTGGDTAGSLRGWLLMSAGLLGVGLLIGWRTRRSAKAGQHSR